MFAKSLSVDRFLVANVNLRDGLIKEMARGKSWLSSIQDQMVRSAIRLGKRYKFSERRSVQITKLACSIYDQLQSLHRLPSRFRSILEIGSLLHEIGNFISPKSKHKHSAYLIRNSEFFGVGNNELQLIALVARYHRGASPQPRHEAYAKLDRFQRVAVSKLAAFLRIAIALDSNHQQRIKTITCRDLPSHVEMLTPDVEDLSMERAEIRKVSSLFTEIFGKEVVLETEGGMQ